MPPTKRKAATERHTGRPALLDDDLDAFRLGCLVPTGAGPGTEPIAVRAIETEHGWRGWMLDGRAPLGAGPFEWQREHWTWREAVEPALTQTPADTPLDTAAQ